MNVSTDGRKERMSSFYAVSKLQICPACGTMRLAGQTKQSDDDNRQYLQLDFSQTKESDEATWSAIKFGEILMYLHT